MNKICIIGNLTKAPELRMTQQQINVCTFTVAVNRRRGGQDEADFFRVTAWRQLAEICSKYLDKGRKVCVIGPVSISTYTGQDGKTHANMEVTADDVEFLSPKHDQGNDLYQEKQAREKASEPIEVDEDELPFPIR